MNKKALCLLALLLITAVAHAQQTSPHVFVIPIEREIDMAAVRQFSSGCRQAAEQDADYVLVRLNTFGGALDAADSIRSGLLRLNTPTIAFVNNNAASAGALIALACDSVFMAPGASMGSATVVNGQGEPMPQKYQSYMINIMRATAEHHGRHSCGPDSGLWRRNPDIAEAMVLPDTSLAFTAVAAVDARYADGIANDIPQILQQLDIENARITVYEPTLTDNILGFLASAGVRAILVMFIFGGIYMEMHTPGLGVAAAIASIAATLYLLPMIVSATLPAWVLILLIAGIVLIVMEIFVIPGFGITGICGMVAVAVALCAAAVTSDGVTGLDIASVGNSLIVVGIGAMLALVTVIYLTSSKGPKALRRHTELVSELATADGYVGVDMSPAQYIGQEGISTTVLRPAGKVAVGDRSFDAVSTGAFIAANRPVKIVKYENSQLYVVESQKDKE